MHILMFEVITPADIFEWDLALEIISDWASFYN